MANNQDKAASRRNPSHRSPHLEHFINQFLDAACDPSRRYILELLLPLDRQDPHQTRELSAGEIARHVGLATSTISEHLRKLLDLHLLSARKEGSTIYYRLRNHQLVYVFHDLLQALETHSTTSSSTSEAPQAVE
jgi:DNA-binding transcriptional ArsR family regulator